MMARKENQKPKDTGKTEGTGTTEGKFCSFSYVLQSSDFKNDDYL